MSRAALVIAALCMLAGCKPVDPTPYLGTWAVSGEGSVTLRSSENHERRLSRSSGRPLPGFRITFARGDGNGLLSTDTFGCQLRWELAKSGATPESGQRCVASNGHAGMTLALESSSLVLREVSPGKLEAKGGLEGSVSEGGGLLGDTQAASAALAVTLTRAEPLPEARP